MTVVQNDDGIEIEISDGSHVFIGDSSGAGKLMREWPDIPANVQEKLTMLETRADEIIIQIQKLLL